MRWLRVARWGAVIFMLGVIGGIILRLVAPIELKGPVSEVVTPMKADLGGVSFFDPNVGASADQSTVLGAIRYGLFRSASPIHDRPVADKTIERIRSQLSLGCILETEGESVAYVRVKDVGLKRCKIGDSVEDLFTVLDINEKSIVISIIDHRATLSL